jgi:hypothetical protein
VAGIGLQDRGEDAIVVVLPAPLGPRKPRMRPAVNEKDSPLSADLAPYVFRSSSATSIGRPDAAPAAAFSLSRTASW